MNLSRFSDLGLRALMILGARDERLSAREIAEFYAVSKDHMMKSLQALERAGFVDSLPGRNGGFRLALDPERIGIGAVVRALEPSLALAECFEAGNTRCPLTGHCALSHALDAALVAFLDRLDEVSLGDLVQARPKPLVQISTARA